MTEAGREVPAGHRSRSGPPATTGNSSWRVWKIRWRRIGTLATSLPIWVLIALLPPTGELHAQSVLTNAEAIRGLPADRLHQNPPVHLAGVVTYADPHFTLFIQDRTAGIYLLDTNVARLPQVGQCVEVAGTAKTGKFAPMVEVRSLRILGDAELPPARRTQIVEMRSGSIDGQRIAITAVLLAVDRAGDFTRLHLACASDALEALIPSSESADRLTNSIGAELRAAGVCASSFNEHGQFITPRLLIPRPGDIEIQRTAPGEPFDLPLTALDGLMRFSADPQPPERVRVRGTVTAAAGRERVYLQHGNRGLRLRLATTNYVQVGQQVDAVGFPTPGEYGIILDHALLRTNGPGESAAPTAVAGPTLDGRLDAQLVSLEGTIAGVSWREDALVYSLVAADGRGFEAYLPPIASQGAPRRPGSHLRLKGVYEALTDNRQDVHGFRLWLRTRADLTVLHAGPWWDSQWVRLGLLLFAALVAGALGWGAVLRARLGQRTRELVRERERYRQLFDQTPVATWEEDYSNLVAWMAKLRHQGISDLASYLDCHPEELPAALGRMKVLMTNRTALDQNRAANAHQLAHDWKLLFTEATFAALRQQLIRLWNGETEIEFESSSRRFDGSPLYLILRIHVPVVEGRQDFSRVIVTGTDITNRKAAEAELARRDAAAATAAQASREMLHSQDERQAIQQVLELVGQAAGADRAYLFECDPLTDGSVPTVSQTAEWCAPGIERQQANPELQRLPMTGAFGEMAKRLERELHVAAHVRDLPAPERGMLERQQVRSLLVVPFHLDDGWQGFLGFDSCEREREWTSVEIGLLQAVTADIGHFRHRARGARELRDSEARFRALNELVPVGIFLEDGHGNCLYVNRQWELLTGYRFAEAKGTGWQRIIHPAERTRLLAEWESAVATNSTFASEFQLIRADGTVAWVSVVAARFTDANGNSQGFLGSLTDITRRKQSEASEREATARLRQLVDGVRGVPWEASTTPWRVTFVGGEGQRKLGYTDNVSIEDGHWFAHLHPDDALGVLETLNQKVAHAESEFELNYRIITVDQRIRWIRDLVKVVPSGTDSPILRGLAIDVTESKAAEEVLQQAREDLERRVEQRTAQLSRRNRELREFTYALAHDIKVPLRGVSNLSDWLVRDYRDALGTEGQRLCRLLGERIQFMHQFVEGILDYTRIGHEKVENSPVALNDIVPHVVEMLSPPDHIQVVVPNDLPVVNGQAEHLLRVFQNLIGNAITYLDKPAGQVTVQAHRLDGAWQFTVADNGPGIPERYHGKLFQLFQPLPNNNGHKGTGVGLAIVKQIIERRGGVISLLSRDGEGSCFQFTWPDQVPTSEPNPAD